MKQLGWGPNLHCDRGPLSYKTDVLEGTAIASCWNPKVGYNSKFDKTERFLLCPNILEAELYLSSSHLNESYEQTYYIYPWGKVTVVDC